MAISFNRTNPDYFTSSAGLSLPNGNWCIAIAIRITSNSGTNRQGILVCRDTDDAPRISIRLHDASFSTYPGACTAELHDGTNLIQMRSTSQVTVGAWVLGVLQRSGSTKELWIGSFGSVPTLQASSTAALGAITVTEPATIGRQSNQTAYNLAGDIAFVAKGDFALDASQRLALARGIPPLKVRAGWGMYLPMPMPAATLRPAIGTETWTRTGSPGTANSPFAGM